MSEQPWTDQIVGERMAVDREFSSRVADSRFSNQEWSLIMTATEFEIDRPEDPEQARLVANTEKVEQILPELENIRAQTATGAPQGPSNGGSGSGLVSSLKGLFGIGASGGVSEAEREAAEQLTDEYARELQQRLESKGRWEAVRAAAVEE